MNATEPVCPAAEAITYEGGLAVVCGVKKADAERADSILEGSPTGVVVTAKHDPSTFFNWCHGTGTPGHPDMDPPPCHYTGCPVWAAGKEIDAAERIWKFEMPDDPAEVEKRVAAELGIEVAREMPDEQDLAKLFGFETEVRR